ncbi:MAG: MBL fold metallo-hydrolase [Hyphomonadaceae bacterium]|nr:MBL fold metallo-hydrolase [Hyphomonadaceae bacterium]
MTIKKLATAMIASALLFGCQAGETPKTDVEAKTSIPTQYVSDAVKRNNRAVEKFLDFSDTTDFELADRGFIGTLDDTVIKATDGTPVYDFGAYDFLDQSTDTINPSLKRQSQLNAKHGLYEVVDGIYQVRGYDLSNVTFIKGDTGWIVVDPLISRETAAAAKKLIDQELGVLPIKAVVFTHSHADHFGGVRGLINEYNVEQGVEIIAPEGFVLESVSENILAGNAMSRRASYMFGSLLPKRADSQVGVGLGQTISTGILGLMEPTIDVRETGQSVTVDGVEMQFIMALGAEAPSEFMFYLPKYKAFCQAEIINHTLHNMLTPRGAKVRDGRIWSQYIDEAVYTYGDITDVSFGSHHWPVWGSEAVIDLWEDQRDLYRYIHDRTLFLANQGVTMHEIPDQMNLPDALAKNFANRDYYGTVSHNSKSQYQLYFGYFDGNPANLNPLNVVDESIKYVEYMGGADAVIEKAKTDFDKGEFRFAATALNHVIFAEANNQQAANLLADTYTQLGYMTESGSWRNFYMTGAKELREGVLDLPRADTSGPDMVRAIPLNMYFDLLAVRLNSEKAIGKDMSINFVVTDTDESATLILSNGTLHHRMGMTDPDAKATLKLTRDALDKINMKTASIGDLRKSGDLEIDGNPLALRSFFALIEEPPFWFEIVRP